MEAIFECEKCEPEHFEINMPPSIQVFEEARVSVSHDVLTCTLGSIYKWHLNLMDDRMTNYDNVFENIKQPMGGNVMNLKKAGEMTPFYEYMWKITVTLTPLLEDFTSSSTSRMFVVTPHEMKLELQGGPNRTHIHGCGPILFNGSDSKDPSFWGKVHPMHRNEIEWKCDLMYAEYKYSKSLVLEISSISYKDQTSLTCKMTVRRQQRTPYHPETASISQSINIIYPSNPPELTLRCVHNCRPSDSFKKTILEWRCMSHCLENLTVSVCRSPIATIYTSPIMIEGEATRNNMVEYQSKAFPPSSTITFTAIMGNGSASVNLTYKSRKPVLSIMCVTNCEFFDVALPLTLAVTCEGRYCEDITYAWKVLPDIKGVTGSSNRSDLTIPEDTMNDGDTVTVQVTAWDGNVTFFTIMRKFVPTFSFDYTIEGVEQCREFVEPENKIKVFITCNCSEKFNFKISPNPKKGVIVGNDTIVIPPYTYTYGDKINITAYQRKYNATFELKYTKTPPEIVINCTENCKKPANTHMETILVGACPKCRLGGLNWKVSGIDEETVRSWSTNMTLTIPARTFNDNQSVSISLSNEYTNTTFNNTFVRPKANLNLECQDNCLPSNPNSETVLNVTCRGEFSVCSDLEYNWEINPKPSKAIVQYGERNSILKIIDGSYSDEDKVNITVHYGEASASKELTYVEPVAELTLVCTDHCDPTYAAHSTTLQVTCSRNCEHLVYNWNITDVPDTFNWLTSVRFSDDKSSLTINGGTFKGGDTKSVTVSSGKASASLALNFVVVDTKLKISCKPPCSDTHNPMNSVLVWVNCTKDCSFIEKYNWTINNNTEESMKFIIMQKNYESFLILPGAFPSGTNLTVDVDSIASETLRFFEPTMDLDIICNDDCTKLNTFIPTNLTAQCKARCTNNSFYSWVLEPPPTNWSLNVINAPYNRYLIINPETYKEGDDVNVTLFIRNSSISKKIHFSHVEAKLSLRCLESCSAANPFEDVEIDVKCDENCEGLEYVWRLETTKTEFNFSRDITLGPGNKTLTIPRKVFKNNDRIVVTVDTGRGKAQGVVHFLVPKLKIYITCVENCKNGEADPLKNVILNVTCVGGCYDNKVSWNFSPKPDDWSYIDLSYPNMTIIGKSYRDKGSVRVTVFNYQSEDHMDIHFIEPTPNISIYCPDCSHAYAEKPLSFKASCKTCLYDIYTYTWEITPQLGSFNWSKNVIFGDFNKSMTIVEDTFKGLDNVVVIVKYGKGEAMIAFKYTIRPKFVTISCIENCNMSNPHERLVLEASCFPDCEHAEYRWSMSQQPQGFIWSKQVTISSNFRVFTLAPDTFSSNQTVVIYALTGPFNGSITVNFVVSLPLITIICNYNCEFDPHAQVILVADCLKFCHKLTYEWKVVPMPKEEVLSLNNENALTILSNSYKHNDKIEVTVEVKGSVANKSISFLTPRFMGKCNIEPSEGQAGVTKFYVDCYNFGRPVFLWLLQYYSKNDHWVALAYGSNDLPDGVFLSKEEPDSGFLKVLYRTPEYFAFIDIPVKVSEFPTEKIPKILFGNGSESLPMLIKRKDYFKVVQLASAMCSAISLNSPKSINQGQHIVSLITSISEDLNPWQNMFLARKFSKFRDNPLTVNLLMQSARTACKKLLSGNEMHYPSLRNQTYLDFTHETMWLLSKLLNGMMAHSPKLNPNHLNPDYPTYTDFSLPRADLMRHAKIFTDDFVAITTQMAQIIRKAGLKHFNHTNVTIVLRDTQFAKNKFALRSSRNDSEPLNDMIYFGFNLFWWANRKIVINTQVIQLLSNESHSQSHQVKVLETPLKVLKGSASELTTLIFDLTEKSLFVAQFYFVNSLYSVSIGSCMPGTSKFTDEAHVVRDKWNFSLISEKKYIYVGITPVESDINTDYKFMFKAQECFSWSSNELAWRNDLCTISDVYHEGFIECKCHEASFLSGRTYIPKFRNISKIELSDSIYVDRHRDWSILLLVLAISGLFVLLLFIAHQQDLSFVKNNKVHFVEDNVPGDKELYLLLITTGMSFNAGTSANVVIKINGKLAHSRVHVLSSGTSNTLKRNSEDFFAIYAPTFLGELKSIQLWHNSCGSSPHWYCESVIVKHPNSHKEYVFEVHRWFSLIYGDGTTKGTFRVSNLRKPKFSWKLRESFRQSNHIFSFYTKRPRPGSSKELVLIFFASLSTVVMAVAVLLQNFEGRDTFSFVWMGCVAALSSIPVAMILGWLFRNSG